MYLIESQGVFSRYSCENINETKQDPIQIIPDALVLKVFSYLTLATLGTICCVSQPWKQLANTPILWKIAIYKEIAFGNDKWAECFGRHVVEDEDSREELSSLPLKAFIQDCKKFKKIFPLKKAKDCLMLVRLPKTLNGGLTLKSVGELAKKYFPASNTGYKHIMPDIIRQEGDKSIDKSQWVLMTQDVFPQITGKNYPLQQKMVAYATEKFLIGYKIPPILAATVCIFSRYFESNIRSNIPLFSGGSEISIRCQEKVNCGYGMVVWGFEPDGIRLLCNSDSGFHRMGVALLREF
ncbi:MAG: F-box protein [Parachlamydiaceae bacterium]